MYLGDLDWKSEQDSLPEGFAEAPEPAVVSIPRRDEGEEEHPEPKKNAASRIRKLPFFPLRLFVFTPPLHFDIWKTSEHTNT
jgi:hypothetical protein